MRGPSGTCAECRGDGRTEADADREARRRCVPSNLELYFAAERIKRQLDEMGITVIYDPVEPDPLTTMTSIVPKPKRKAS